MFCHFMDTPEIHLYVVQRGVILPDEGIDMGVGFVTD